MANSDSGAKGSPKSSSSTPQNKRVDEGDDTFTNSSPPEALHRSLGNKHFDSAGRVLQSRECAAFSTDDDSCRVDRLLRKDTGISASEESLDLSDDSSTSSVDIRAYPREKPKPEQTQSDVAPVPVEPVPPPVDHGRKRALQKRTEIRTAEDRKRAIAHNREASKRKPATKRLVPAQPMRSVDKSSESSDSSPDVEDVEDLGKKPSPRRAPVRKCPVEQIDVDCEMGHRPYMEDALVALQDITAYLPNNSRIKNDIEPTAFFGVYDGHGGFQASRYVQKFFHVRLLEELKELKQVEGFVDLHSVIKSVYRRIDHDFLNHCNVPSEGIPPLLSSMKPLLKEKGKQDKKRKRNKDKKASEFTTGPYIKRIMNLQRERARDRNHVVNILRNIPTEDGESVSIDALIREPATFDKLDQKDARAFKRFIQRYAQTNAEAYELIKAGKTDFRRSVSDPNYDPRHLTMDTWSDGSLMTSDDNVSELSGVDSDLGEQSIAEIEADEDGVQGEGTAHSPPLRAKDDPMTKNPPTPGSTVCVCLIDREYIYSSWLGDSEAVLFSRGGQVTNLTQPHSPLREDEAERIRRLGGVVVRQSVPGLKKQIGRVQGQLSVSRAIGDAHLKRWVSSDPEMIKTRLTGEEEFAVIASDGLWDVLSFKEVYRLVSRYITTERKKHNRRGTLNATRGPSTTKLSTQGSWSRAAHANQSDLFASGENTNANRASRHRQKAGQKRHEGNQWSGCARYLIRTALTCGSSDNISVIVIFFKGGLARVGTESSSRPPTHPSETTIASIAAQPSTDDNTSDSRRLRRRENEREGLFSGVGLFNRARIRRVFARNTQVELGSQSEDETPLIASPEASSPPSQPIGDVHSRRGHDEAPNSTRTTRSREPNEHDRDKGNSHNAAQERSTGADCGTRAAKESVQKSAKSGPSEPGSSPVSPRRNDSLKESSSTEILPSSAPPRSSRKASRRLLPNGDS